MSISPVAASVSQAKRGSESFKAHTLSQQFQNLCRGESFAKEQMAKWKHPETGLKKDDLMIVESLAYRAMKYFGYEAAHVKEPCDGECSYCTCPLISRNRITQLFAFFCLLTSTYILLINVPILLYSSVTIH